MPNAVYDKTPEELRVANRLQTPTRRAKQRADAIKQRVRSAITQSHT